jgi:hypothetical protein
MKKEGGSHLPAPPAGCPCPDEVVLLINKLWTNKCYIYNNGFNGGFLHERLLLDNI